MNITIAGGSGFLGRALTRRLRERGDTVSVLTRRASGPGEVAWAPGNPDGPWLDAIAEADAVVNLAGESIADGRWTADRKRRLIESRMTTTRAIVNALGSAKPDGVLLSASAVGYYGDRGDETLTEASSPGDDFLARLCRDWESEARRAEGSRRVVLLRTGLVLDPGNGALAPLMTPFRLGVGGPMGSGRQYWSWIHREDWVRLVIFAIDDSRARGAMNLTAPNAVTNRDFARALGRALSRPALLPAPAFALRLLLGEMADAMVLSGQRVIPELATSLGFTFAFTDLDAALRDLLD